MSHLIGFKLLDAKDVCPQNIWHQMFDFKIFNVEDI